MFYHLISFKRLSLMGAILSLLSISTVSAQDLDIRQSAVPFLKINPDVRSMSLGDVHQGLDADPSNILLNNAKAVFSDHATGLGVNFAPWSHEYGGDVFLGTVSGYHNLNENQAISGGIRFFDLGNYNVQDDGGNFISSTHPREYAIEGGFAQKISQSLSVGVTLRYINSSLLEDGGNDGSIYKAAQALAGNLAIAYDGRKEDGEGVTGGFTISNLGNKISYSNQGKDYFLPATVSLGAAYTQRLDEDNTIRWAVDGGHLLVPLRALDEIESEDYSVISGAVHSFNNKAFQLGSGVEYGYINKFFARAGYHYETENQGSRKYFAAGLGVNINVFNLNIAYLVNTGNSGSNLLANNLKFGVSVKF